MEKKITIVGAGIAGLSAGIYARMNGYETLILEMHTLPGGLCTGWERKGYKIDGCLHWLVGSGPAAPFHKVWLETGALPGDGVINSEEFIRLEGEDGRQLIVYADVSRLEHHLCELAPEDNEEIKGMCNLIRKFSDFTFPIDSPQELAGLKDVLQMIRMMKPYLKDFKKLSKMSLTDYCGRFKSCFLRENLSRLFGADNFPAIGFIMTMANLNAKTAGWPVGGSLALAQRMERRYRELGGKISYKSRVDAITVEKKRATGVVLEDGTRVESDIVISAADGYSTLFKMLGEEYVSGKLKKTYSSIPLSDSTLQVSFGVNMDLSGQPHSISIPLKEGIRIGGNEVKELYVRHYCVDRSMAPEGKSVVVCLLGGNFDWWSKFSDDRDGYERAKEVARDAVKVVLEERFPGFKDAVEVTDVATPLTYVRYTGNRKGSIMGWKTDTNSFNAKRARTLPKVKNFYMAGHWAETNGGLPPAVISGRQIVQVICKRDDRKFIVER